MHPTRSSEVKAWCLSREFRPNRTLGQNFLVDRNILDAIVAAAELAPGDAVLEVGPGLGAVTQALLESGARVTAVEKDHRLAEWIRESLGMDAGLTIIEADMLDVPLDALLAHPDAGLPGFAACVSNLPYSSGTRILLDLCRHPLAPARLVVTVQREVAERIGAGPCVAARGLAGVWVQQTYDVEMLRTIKPACFWPRPGIASTLVRLVRHDRYRLAPMERKSFDELTRHAFMHRRKQMAAMLRLAPPELGLEAREIVPFLDRAGVNPGDRAEVLTNSQWVVLARALAASREAAYR